MQIEYSLNTSFDLLVKKTPPVGKYGVTEAALGLSLLGDRLWRLELRCFLSCKMLQE